MKSSFPFLCRFGATAKENYGCLRKDRFLCVPHVGVYGRESDGEGESEDMGMLDSEFESMSAMCD